MYLLLLVGAFLFIVAVPTVGEIVNQFNVECEPQVVRYTDVPGEPNRLQLELRILNPPPMEGLDYKVLSYTKEGDHFVPKYNLKMGTTYEPTMYIEQNVYKSWADSYIAYYLVDEKKLNSDLIKENLYNIAVLKYSADRVENSACIVGKCIFTLDMDNDCKKTQPSTSYPKKPLDQNTGWKYRNSRGLSGGNKRGQMLVEVTSVERHDKPEIDIDKYYYEYTGLPKSYISIYCKTRAQWLDLLSLYQEPKGQKPVLLKKVQYLSDKEGFISLTATKNLKTIDKESKIYCVNHRPGDQSGMMTSKKIRLREYDYSFLSLGKPVELFVESGGDIAGFDQHTALRIVCRGNKSHNDRNMTWYIQDAKTLRIEIPDSNSQEYNRDKNENILNITLNYLYDAKLLFCAQDRYINVQFPNGSSAVERYDVLATSRNITLKLVDDKGGIAETGKKTNQFLIWGLVLGAGALVSLVAVVLFRLLKKRVEGGRENAENNYATAAELTYAVLDLSEPQTTARAANTTPYAQIIGVYNPHKTN